MDGLRLTARGVVYGRLLTMEQGEARSRTVSSLTSKWDREMIEAAIAALIAEGALTVAPGDVLLANPEWL